MCVPTWFQMQGMFDDFLYIERTRSHKGWKPGALLKNFEFDHVLIILLQRLEKQQISEHYIKVTTAEPTASGWIYASFRYFSRNDDNYESFDDC
jgi:hypothetical protein